MGQSRGVGIVFLLAGLLFMALGVYVAFFSHAGYVETTGTITRVESVGTGSNRHRVYYVTYKVDGETYEAASNTTNSSYRQGKRITVYYDPSNPSKMAGDSGSLGYIVMGISGVTILFSILMITGKITGTGRNYRY